MGNPRFQIKKRCKFCGNEFIAHQLNTVYCCKHCAVQGFKLVQKEAKEQARRDKIVAAIPEGQEYITIPQARAMFGIGRNTIYRMIRRGKLPFVNLGTRLIRVSLNFLKENYPLRTKQEEVKCQTDIYNLAIENCYTMAEIMEKYKVCHAAIFKQIRRYGIPIRQIGTNVYAPKKEIDEIYNQGKANEKKSTAYKVHG